MTCSKLLSFGPIVRLVIFYLRMWLKPCVQAVHNVCNFMYDSVSVAKPHPCIYVMCTYTLYKIASWLHLKMRDCPLWVHFNGGTVIPGIFQTEALSLHLIYSFLYIFLLFLLNVTPFRFDYTEGDLITCCNNRKVVTKPKLTLFTTDWKL